MLFSTFNIFSLLIFLVVILSATFLLPLGYEPPPPQINTVPKARNHLSSSFHVTAVSPKFNITDSNILP